MAELTNLDKGAACSLIESYVNTLNMASDYLLLFKRSSDAVFYLDTLYNLCLRLNKNFASSTILKLKNNLHDKYSSNQTLPENEVEILSQWYSHISNQLHMDVSLLPDTKKMDYLALIKKNEKRIDSLEKKVDFHDNKISSLEKIVINGTAGSNAASTSKILGNSISKYKSNLIRSEYDALMELNAFLGREPIVNSYANLDDYISNSDKYYNLYSYRIAIVGNHVTGLRIYNWNIRSVPEPVKKLTNLQKLILTNNHNLFDINVLSSLTNLQILHLNNNDIYDVSALSSLTNLKELDLCGNNNINNVSNLRNLSSNLHVLYLDDKYLNTLKFMAEIEKKEEVKKIVNKLVNKLNEENRERRGAKLLYTQYGNMVVEKNELCKWKYNKKKGLWEMKKKYLYKRGK